MKRTKALFNVLFFLTIERNAFGTRYLSRIFQFIYNRPKNIFIGNTYLKIFVLKNFVTVPHTPANRNRYNEFYRSIRVSKANNIDQRD